MDAPSIKSRILSENAKHPNLDWAELAAIKIFRTQEESRKATHSRIVLVGKAASGKDYARKVYESRGFKYGISYTTRPARVGEVNGVDYHFISTEAFDEMRTAGLFYEWVPFNGWYYGTTLEQFYRDDIFIMTPKGIAHIPEEDRKKTMIIYFDIPYDIRKERLALRSDADTVDRRLKADELDFEDFKEYDIKITSPTF